MIVYVVPFLHTWGGMQEYAKLTYSELVKDYEIYLLDWKEIELSLVTKAILRFFHPRFGCRFFSHSIWPKYRKTYEVIKDAELVHFWSIVPAMSFLDKKYVVTCHGMELLPSNVRGFRREMYPRVLNKALKIHVNSKYTKSLVLSLITQKTEIRIIPPAIDYKKFAKTYCKVRKRNQIIIGTLARLVPRKNISNIIKALNILKEKYSLDFTYYLAGDGPNRKKNLAELSKSKFEWKYFGKISEEEKIKELYPSLDIFIMPPLELPNSVEGFGIVYLEANAYGIPVVASKTGGVPDAVEEGISGIFANPTDPEDIALKTLELIKDKDKYEDSAREWAKQFDVRKIVKQYTEMYDEVLKAR